MRDNFATGTPGIREERIMVWRFATRLVTTGLLVFSCAAISWAGVGDIDSNFGTSGRLLIANPTVLLVQGDRLLIGTPDSDGYRVTRFDAHGQIDTTFGNGGSALVRSPDRELSFEAFYASRSRDGGLLLAGWLHDLNVSRAFEVVVHLDGAGRVEMAYGGRGDGFYRLTDEPIRERDDMMPTTVMGLVTDASGRALLARRSWTADWRCGGPSSVLRLSSAGTPDTTFGELGLANVAGVDLCGGVAILAARADGSVVVGIHSAIFGLDVHGQPDPTFGVDGLVSHGSLDGWNRGFLMPDGGIVIVERADPTTAYDAVITRLNRAGVPDTSYGSGTGSVPLVFDGAFFGISDSRQSIRDFALMPDAAHLYLYLEVRHPDGTTACPGGIARFSFDGKPDLAFGREGLTCLDYGQYGFRLLAVQQNGSPLFWHLGSTYGGVYRLLTDDTPSPGMLTMVRHGDRVNVGEADGEVDVRVMRTAGHDGAVSLAYKTGPRHVEDIDSPNAYNATPGDDFEAAIGSLHWPDGDDSERHIAVKILTDGIDEGEERFSISTFEPKGGALAFTYDFYPDYEASVNVAIANDNSAPPVDPPPAPPSPTSNPHTSSGSGGGGASSWAIVFFLTGLILARRRFADAQ